MIKVGIVGMGKMGLTHAAMLEVLSPGCIAGVVETDRGNHGTIKSLGLRAPVYSDLEALLANHALDAAIVCTPSFTHYPIVKALIDRGVAVMVEKPLAENIDKCRALAKLASEKKAITAVGYSIDYDPLFTEARRLIQKGSIGKINKYWSWVEHSTVLGPKKGWFTDKAKSGGGVIVNPAPHMLFFMLEAFGLPRRVRATVKSIHSAVDDEALVSLEHENGCVGELKANWSVPNKPVLDLSLFIEGEAGSMAIGDDEILLDGPGGTRRIGRADIPVESSFELAPPARASNYYREDRDFLENVRLKRASRNSVENTLKVDQLIDAIYRSAERKEAVSWT
ncbi:MAG: Gfo/Idh/MocA family protein [Elusimicrobiota bacterium]